MEKRRQMVHTALPPELLSKVETEAKRRLTSKASIIREALLQYFAAK